MDSTFILESNNNKMEKYSCRNIVASGHTAVNMSRHSLLQWINEELGEEIKKVEALCSGSVYCRLMENIFPGCIPMRKIKLDANVMNEYWSNFKQLQIAFRAVGCEKDVPIDRLIEGRFQENFEFLQWFKRFYDANAGQSPVKSVRSKQTETKTPSQTHTSRVPARPVAIVNPVVNNKQVESELKSQISDYEERARKVKAEKDFYFHKLRKIELLCSDEEAPKTKKKDFIEKILAELYAEEITELPGEE